VTISLQSIPSVTAAEALAAVKRKYGLVGDVALLPSERDQNFLITDADGGKFVFKVANAGDSAELLDFQNRAMRRVATSPGTCHVQQVLSSLQGLDITHILSARTGVRHFARLLTWIDGHVLAKSVSREPALFESIGANMGRIDAALCGFSHPAMHRILQWDLRRADMARENLGLLPQHRRAQVERHFSQWARIDWSVLRHGVIHGDANDHNVIVDTGRMAGLLDFGDMVHTAIVCELAITLAYTMLDEKEPLSAASQVIRAYQRGFPLTEAELQVLFPLVLARLSMSVCYSAHNRARNPDDPYQVVSEAAAWHLLDKLELLPAKDALEFSNEAGVPVPAGAGRHPTVRRSDGLSEP
jgi:Ser/Thr protein kinase RdoA (MazF antagonist)